MDDYARPEEDWDVPKLSADRPDPVLDAIGRTIRRLRSDRGVSQEDLALLAGIDRSYLGRIERGENNVAILTLVKLAQALEVSVAELSREVGI